MAKPQDIDSPLIAIWDEIETAAFSIAPERASELGDLSEDLGVSVRLDQDDGKFWFAAIPETGEILLGLGALERLWAYCMAYAHVVVTSQEQVARGGKVNLTTTDEGALAMKLLAWAQLPGHQTSRLPWPSNLPVPDPSSPAKSLGLLANGIYRTALGWILLHEVGHVVHKHQPPGKRPLEQLVREEREADKWAFDWALNDELFAEDKEAYLLRSTGVTVGLSLITAFEVYYRTGGQTHPDPPDRLWQFLDRYVPSSMEGPYPPGFPWTVAVCIVKLHLDHDGVVTDPTIVYPNSRECLSDLLFAFKRQRPPPL